MQPPLSTTLGLTPKQAGFHSTMSAHLPICPFAHGQGAHLVGDAIGQRRVAPLGQQRGGEAQQLVSFSGAEINGHLDLHV